MATPLRHLRSDSARIAEGDPGGDGLFTYSPQVESWEVPADG
ncbi:hypothetical protein [Planotetraspora sp. GP83]